MLCEKTVGSFQRPPTILFPSLLLKHNGHQSEEQVNTLLTTHIYWKAGHDKIKILFNNNNNNNKKRFFWMLLIGSSLAKKKRIP